MRIMTPTHCGQPMICADSNTTGYWPYMPHRCGVCGAVRYAMVEDDKGATMASNKTSVDAMAWMHSMTLRVTIKRATEMRWRLWVGLQLLRLAKVVFGCADLDAKISNVRDDD